MCQTRRVGLEGASSSVLPTTDGLTLKGWFVSHTDTPEFTVIVFNGNAGNRAFRAPLADALLARIWRSSFSTIAVLEAIPVLQPRRD